MRDLAQALATLGEHAQSSFCHPLQPYSGLPHVPPARTRSVPRRYSQRGWLRQTAQPHAQILVGWPMAQSAKLSRLLEHSGSSVESRRAHQLPLRNLAARRSPVPCRRRSLKPSIFGLPAPLAASRHPPSSRRTAPATSHRSPRRFPVPDHISHFGALSHKPVSLAELADHLLWDAPAPRQRDDPPLAQHPGPQTLTTDGPTQEIRADL